MSDQEMQFADPDWEPTRPLTGNTGAQGKQASAAQAPTAPNQPRPINDAWREQSRPPVIEIPDGSAGNNDLPPYTGYVGSMPSQEQPYTYQSQSMRSRGRRRGPWLWIILIVLFFSLFGGGFGSLVNFGQKDAVQDHVFNTITGTPVIVLNDPNGDIHVQQGNTLDIQTDKRTGLFDDPNNIHVTFKLVGSTINVNVDTGSGFLSDRSVNFTITVPQNVNLELQTDSGDISVNNATGQANLKTASGDISTTNDTFSASSSLQTDSGDITATGDTFSTNSSLQTISGDVYARNDSFEDSTAISTTSGDISLDGDSLKGTEKFTTTSGDIDFNGSVDSTGKYQFGTTDGDITINLQQPVSFAVNAQTTSGSIDTDGFPTIQVQDSGPGPGASASGNVGSGPFAQFTITTVNGDITLHQR